MCSYFCKNLPVAMYRKFRNVPIFKDIPPICPYFLGFRVGKYVIYLWVPTQLLNAHFIVLDCCLLGALIFFLRAQHSAILISIDNLKLWIFIYKQCKFS